MDLMIYSDDALEIIKLGEMNQDQTLEYFKKHNKNDVAQVKAIIGAYAAELIVAADEAEAERRMNEECDEREKSMTCFHRTDDGTPMLWDYQIKGFFKDACGALRTVPKTESGKIKAYKKVIDGQIFVDERRIPLCLPEGGEIGICERPLRAQTMQGERVALAKSESVPAGTTFEITITMLDPSMEDVVREWLDYGALRGIGQWRNSGMGRIKWEEVK